MTAVAIDPRVHASAYLERGIAYLRRNEFAAARSDFDMALSFDPEDPFAHWNKATALLSLGDYANGFREHEWGWRLFNWRGFGPVRDDIDRLQALPLWDGTEGKRLLLYHELGFGDAIMCLRYLPALQQRTASLTLVIDQCLARLAREFDVDVATKVPQSLHAFDCRLPFFSAMTVLRQNRETIPRAPYIKADWQRSGGNIGIAWSGRTQTMFSADAFVSLLNCRGYELHALQPYPGAPDIIPLDGEDFTDTVKVIELVDHVVTVDTAVAHLAGAMGHPSTHVVVPFMSDWRWWHADVWYPAIKVYRQPRVGTDWSESFAQVRAAVTGARS